jgi:hypothetical protein
MDDELLEPHFSEEALCLVFGGGPEELYGYAVGFSLRFGVGLPAEVNIGLSSRTQEFEDRVRSDMCWFNHRIQAPALSW